VRSLARALLVLNVLYCLLAVAQEGLPGWHMFESVEPLDHELRDRDDRLVDVRDWLPRGANVVDRGELREIVAFVCEKERARAPFTYVERSQHLRVTLGVAPGREGCKVHAPR
jgi:hypothetical protein